MQLRVVEAGDRGAPVVVLAHGFPELAYSWRHQIPALAEAGYHVLAPDQRGYGGSSRPDAIDDYNIVALCGDIAGLLDDVGAERAVIVGHDWGAMVAWHCRCCTRTGCGCGRDERPACAAAERHRRSQIWRELFGENFFYILYFQEPGIADAELEPRPRQTLRRVFGGPAATGRHRRDRADARRRARRVSSTGCPSRCACRTGSARTNSTTTWRNSPAPASPAALNWYRNFDRNWELTATTPATTITVPSLFIGGHPTDACCTFTRATASTTSSRANTAR